MIDVHIIELNKKKECLIDLSSHKIYKRKFLFFLWSCLWDNFFSLCFYVWSHLFSHLSSGCSILYVDRMLVVTVHLISTCCPFRISCTNHHHQTYRIPRTYIYIREKAHEYIYCQSVKLAARYIAIIVIFSSL